MRKIKVAVIGVGRLGSLHARLYKELPQAQLIGVCDTEQSRLKEICRQLDVSAFGDYRQLFDKVEAVSIATPTHLHFSIAEDFLKHGIHTLVEKPYTTTLKEARRLNKVSRRKHLIIQVGHVERFNSAFSATQKIIKNPRFIECHRLSPFPGRCLDVGVVLDVMIHDIDIVLGLVNSKINKIEATGINVLTNLEDIANARITFKNGCTANLTASRVSDEVMRKIRIFFENTYISLDYKNERAFVYKKADAEISKQALPIEKEQPLKKEISHFLDCVAQHKQPLISGEVAQQALKVALDIQKQIRNHLHLENRLLAANSL
jgi:predicted dehydrogenase